MARSWASSPSSTSPITRSSTSCAGSARPTGKLPAEIELGGRRVPFGIDLLFEARGDGGLPGHGSVVVGIEICEDLWVPVPPSALQAMAGATVLLNLSASNETIGKSQYRTDLVVGQSGRTISAYAMAGSGPSESTTDVVFGGHCLIAENGQSCWPSRPGSATASRSAATRTAITRDVDVAKLLTDRRVTTSFDDGSVAREAVPPGSVLAGRRPWTA